MKNFLLKTWLILVCLVCGAGLSWAQVYTLDTTLETSKGKNSSYTSSGDVTIGGVAWNCAGNMSMTPWRIGGKSITNADRAVYTKTAYESALSQIDLTVGAATSVTVNSLKLIYSTSEDFSNAKEINGEFSQNSTISFKPTSGEFPANAYYKFDFNITIAKTSNCFIEFKKVEFYGGSGSGAATLQSISLSGDYTKSFYVGDKFNFGGTVTANYSDNSTKDVTEKTEFSGYDLSTVGQQTVTASYKEVSVTKTAKYSITVNNFTTHAGTYTIELNMDFYGIDKTGNNGDEQSAQKYGVTVVSGCESNASNKTYYEAADIRYYVDSYLKLTAPAGYVLTKVEFVEPTSNKSWGATDSESITVNAGTYTNSNKTWAGATSTLQFDFSKQCRVASIIVTYEEAGNVEVPTLTSIEVTGTPEVLWLNSEFNHNGITVNANWSNGTVTDVTNYCEFSGYNMSVAGDQTVTVTYEGKTTAYTLTVKDNRFVSLAALVAAGAPTAEGTPVTVTLTNDVIKSIFKTSKGDRNGIFLEANGQQVEIYCKDVPKDWAAGGTVSGTLTNCTWKLYSSTWELCPADWSELSYTAPAAPVYYTVTIETPEHGAIEVKNGDKTVTSGSQVLASTRLSLTFTPEDGYELENWIAVDKNGSNTFSTKSTWDLSSDVTFKANFKIKQTVVVPDGKFVTWDLSKDETTEANGDHILWEKDEVTMLAERVIHDGASANNYYPGTPDKTYKSTRFYSNEELTFTPANGITISSIVITATTPDYAAAFVGGGEGGTVWANATASNEGTIVTIVPTNGAEPIVADLGKTAGASSVTVYYTGEVIPVEHIYYTITVDESVIGGTITADRQTAEEGDKVTLTATPIANYKFASWNVHLEGSSESISVSNNVFVMPAGNVVVSAVFKSNTEIDENGYLIVTYDFNDKNAYPEDFPTSNGTTAEAQSFKISGNDIIINAPTGYYQINSTNDDNRGLFFGKTSTVNNNPKDGTAYLEFPAKKNYKLVNVKAITVGGCAGNVAINIYDKAWQSYSTDVKTVANGTEEARTLSFDLSNSSSNTAYRLSSGTSDKNMQLISITLTYAPSEDGGGTSYEGATIGTLTRYIDGLLKGQGSLGEVKKIENAILRK